jgi:Zn-dependent peptidase ImmA (M78 family)
MLQSMLVEVAADLRQRANQTEPAFSTHHIVEARFPGALVTGRDLPPGIDEAVSETPAGVVILYRRSLPTSSQRFVIAHALAHLLFDGRTGAARPGSRGPRAREERADRFAAELLVPLELLAEYVGRWPSDHPVEREKYLDQVDEIASHFHVPSGLIDKRIRELHTRGNHTALSS